MSQLQLLLFLVLVLSVPLAQAPKLVETTPVAMQTTRGETWNNVCDGVTCYRELYSGGVNIKDADGNYVPFTSMVKLGFSDGNIKMYYDSSKTYYDIILQPVFVMKANEYTWSELPAWVKKGVTINKLEHSYKYEVTFTNLTDNIHDNLLYIDLRRVSAANLTWDDIEKDEGGIIIKDKIYLGAHDLIESHFNLSVNKSQIRIGNITENMVQSDDGSWNVTLDPTVQLQTPNSENLADITARTAAWTEYYVGTPWTGKNESVQIKFNITSVKGSVVIDAQLCFFVESTYSTISSRVNVTHINNQTWDENTISNTSYDNSVIYSAANKTFSPALFSVCQYSCWSCLDIDDIVSASLGYDEYNLTVRLTGMGYGLNSSERSYKHTITESINTGITLQYGNYHAIAPEALFSSKEYTDTSLRPYLNITYTPSHANYSSLSTNKSNYTIINQSTIIQVSALWQANSSQNMSHGWIYTNGTGSWVNQNHTLLNGRTGSQINWTNISFSTRGFSKGLFAVKIVANDTSGAENSTGYWYWDIPLLQSATPPNRTTTLNQTDSESFNITVKNNGMLTAIFNVTCREGAICNTTNFTINYSHSSFSVASGNTQQVQVNLYSNTIGNAMYKGNLSVKSLNTTEEVNFTLQVNISSAGFGIADLINTSISHTQYDDENVTMEFYVNNTGTDTVTCNFYSSTTPSLTSYEIFNISNAVLAVNSPLWVRMYIAKPPAQVYWGSLVMDCDSTGDSASFVVDSNVRPTPSGGGGATEVKIIGLINLTTIPTVFMQDIAPGMALSRDMTIQNPNSVSQETRIQFYCSDDESCHWFSVDNATVVVPGGNQKSPGRTRVVITARCPQNAEYGEYLTTVKVSTSSGELLIPYRLIVTQFSLGILANQIISFVADNIILVAVGAFVVILLFGRRRRNRKV